MISMLAEEFKNKRPAIVQGGIDAQEKFLEVQRFQTDKSCRLFIGQTQAAGVGLTLTASDIAVFAEIDWVPGNIFQAVDRIHRIGQDRGVLIQFFVIEDSLEDYMLQQVVFKKDTIEKLIGDDERGNGSQPGSDLFN
jgi:SNF2 family DNA or RNA helicase